MKIHHIFLNLIKKIKCYENWNAENEDLKNEFIISGIDKLFIQFEFSWKVLKELLRYEGKSAANSDSPRKILKAAYEVYDFIDEDVWLDMLKLRKIQKKQHNFEGGLHNWRTYL